MKKVCTLLMWCLMFGIGNNIYSLSVETELSHLLSGKKKLETDVDNKTSLTVHLLTQAQYRKALITSGEILVLEPENSMGYVLKGIAYEGLQDIDNAVASFEQAIELNPEESAAFNRLGYIYYQIKHDPTTAKQYLLKAIKYNPQDITAHRLISTIYLDAGDFKSAKAHIKLSMLPSDKNSDNTNIFIIKYFMEKQKYDDAIKICKEALEKEPNNILIRSLLGNTLILKKQYKDAIAQLQKILVADPHNYTAYILLAQAYEAIGQDDEVIQYLEKAQLIAPEKPIAFILLGQFYFKQNQLDNALYQFKEVIKIDKTNIMAKLTVVQIYQKLKKFDQALEQSLEIRQQHGFNLQNEVLLAYSYRNIKDLEKAKQTYQLILQEVPDSLPAHMELGDIFYSEKQFDNAQRHYTAVINAHPAGIIEQEAYIKSAQIHNAKKDFEAMESVLRKGLKQFPKSPIIRINLSNILVSLNKIEDAKFIMEQGLKELPEEPSFAQNLGLIYLQQGNDKEAEQKFKDAIKIKPDYIKAISSLANIYWMRKKPEEVFELLDSKITKFPNSLQLRQLRASYYIKNKQFSKAEKAYLNLNKQFPNNPNILFLLSDTYRMEGKFDKAIQPLLQIHQLIPKLLEPLIRIGLMYEELKNYPLAISYYRKALALDDKNALLLNNLAWLLTISEGKLNEAMELAERANTIAPNNGPVLDTLGWIYFLKGNIDIAQKNIEHAAELTPDIPSIQYHLGKIYLKINKQEQAKKVFQKALKLGGDTYFLEKEDILDELHNMGVQ